MNGHFKFSLASPPETANKVGSKNLKCTACTRANASNFIAFELLLFVYSAAFHRSFACAGLKPAGFVPGSPLHLALFLGPLRPRKSRLYGVNGLNEVVRLGTDGEWPLFDAFNFVFFKKDNLDAFALRHTPLAFSIFYQNLIFIPSWQKAKHIRRHWPKCPGQQVYLK